MNILITGGTGFLGSNLYQYIRRTEPNVDIEIFSRRTGKDVRNYQQVEEAVKGKDLIIHAAAQTHVDFSLHKEREDQVNFLRTNAEGTLNVTHACQRYRVKMIHISTSEVYGQNMNPGVPMTEEHPLLAQAGIYATSKAFADLNVRMSLMTTDLDAIILRPFNYWGPGQSIEKLIPRMINQGMKKQPLTIYGRTGLQKRDYIYIQDVCSAIWELKDWNDPYIFNIASGQPLTILEIANIISNYFKIPIVHVDPRPGEVMELYGDISRITTLTNWKPTKFINKESMKGVIEWYLENQPIQQPTL